MTAKKIKVFPPTLNLNAKQDQGGYNAKGHTNRANRRHTDAHINQQYQKAESLRLCPRQHKQR